MRNFTQIGFVDVLPLRLQIERHPELWGQRGGRTEQEGSAHNGVPDIWLRWRNEKELTAPESFNEPFAEIEWYPAMAMLPAARIILMDIMTRVGGTALGGCLISRIPPGGQVKPHSDAVSWHANYYRTKVHTVIRTNPRVSQWVSGEVFVPAAGEVFIYNNLVTHAVYNEGDDDRWTMICAINTV